LQHSGQSRGVSTRDRSVALEDDDIADVASRASARVGDRRRAARNATRDSGIASSRRRDDRGGAPMRRAAVCVISYTRRPLASLAPRQIVRAERIAGELEVAAPASEARGGRDAGRETRDARERERDERRRKNERTGESGEIVKRENIREASR